MTESTLPPDCEPAKWQSRQKHEFLQEYLSVWTDNVGRKGGIRPPFSVIDLFAAYGWCATNEPLVTEPRWPGSAVIAARALSRYEASRHLVLNSFVPGDDQKSRHQLLCLRRAIEAEVGLRPRFKVTYLSTDVSKAIDVALSKAELRYPTLWLLDPYSPDQLPWSVVERLASRTVEYKSRGGVQSRRPELFVTLMTHALQRNIDTHPEMVSQALGLSEEQWRPPLGQYLASEANTRQALISLYAQRLLEIYGKEPVAIEVDGVEGNVIYAVLLCTESDAGYYMTRVHKLPRYAAWKKHQWTPEAMRLSRNKRLLRREGTGARLQSSLPLESKGQE